MNINALVAAVRDEEASGQSLSDPLAPEILDNLNAQGLALVRFHVANRRSDNKTQTALVDRLGVALAARLQHRDDQLADRRGQALAGKIGDALANGPLTPSELAERLGVDISQISRSARTLREQGALHVTHHEHDKRRRTYALGSPTDQCVPYDVVNIDEVDPQRYHQ